MWLMRLVARVLHLSIDVLKYDGKGRPWYTAGKLKQSFLDGVFVRRWFVCECGERAEAQWERGGLALSAVCPRACAGFMRFVLPLHQQVFHHAITV